ncbi:MAG: cation diffusion facilitator family transporter [Candidatus Micrarchaeota archaeon]|nr:cation diffusion facilitator family transporter [Candidatus Micrarchaeota archaeon]
MESGSLRTTKLIIGANVFLIASKLAVALLTGSIAVIAVLVDSCFDFVGSLFAYYGVKKSEEPSDSDHHYGHSKFGSLSSLAQLFLILITALAIIWESARRFLSPQPLPITNLDIAIMALTVAVDIGIIWYLRKNADRASPAIAAAEGNYTSDIAQNSLVLVSLFATASGWLLADPIAGFLVALFMLRVVREAGAGAFSELTDESPPKAELEAYGREIMKVSGIRSFHKLRARKIAGRVHIDVHLQVSPKMRITQAHNASRRVKKRLLSKFPRLREVLVHIEPADRWQKSQPKYGG